ncbi:MAG: LacI family transcriptional regulator, partial [Planctomycetes bacterium]|nr:LacI family transcriptional regulator [Planctomycetota bacterium]
KEIADRLKLSRSLVSKVLNGNLGTTKVKPETARAILDLAAKLGYRPNPTAVSLATGRQGTIGVLIRRFGIPASRLPDTLTDGISEEARLVRQRLVLTYYGDDTETRCFELLTESNRIDGLIFAGKIHPRLAADLATFDAVPVVSVCTQKISDRLSWIGIDNHRIGYLAAEHLIQRGCRRLALIDTWEHRSRGVLHAMRDGGVEVFDALTFKADTFRHTDGAAAVRHFLASGVPFDGLIAQSDEQAAGAINELRRCGIDVPGRVKITGVDNAPFCEFCACPLTSVDQNLHHAGRLALRTLMRTIDDPRTPPVRMEVEPVLVARASTQ